MIKSNAIPCNEIYIKTLLNTLFSVYFDYTTLKSDRSAFLLFNKELYPHAELLHVAELLFSE